MTARFSSRARAGVVLVEDDVEGPVQVVLDRPMRPDGVEELARAHCSREQEIAGRARRAAVRQDAARIDAADGGEAREGVRGGKRLGRQHAGAPALLPAMTGLGGLMEGCILAGAGEARRDGGKERPAVALEAEAVMRLAARTARAISAWPWSASAVTVQPLSTRPLSSASVALTSPLPGARPCAMASRVSVSQTLTIMGGIWARPFS